MLAAVAAGAYKSTTEAQEKMGCGFSKTYQPNPTNVAKYDKLYRKYQEIGKLLEGHLRNL